VFIFFFYSLNSTSSPGRDLEGRWRRFSGAAFCYFHPMKKLRAFIHAETTAGRFFESTIQVLIVLSIVTFSVDTLPNLDENLREALNNIELISVIVFTIEYVLRIIAAEHKLKFIFSFFGIIDLLAIAPFYLSLGLDLRSMRSLRLLRIFRVFKLVRYNKALKRFNRAIGIAREEIVIFLSAAVLLIYLTAVGIYYFEHSAQPDKFASIFDSLWWAVVTLTTVGYGDIYPITIGGKIFTIVILLIGLGIVAVPTGLLASALNTVREEEDM
jgi:voltage-gated potassium channel